METHGIINFMTGNYLKDLIDPCDLNVCKYYDENEFNQLGRNMSNYLNIYSMNIRSLPKHGGELSNFLNILEATFQVIVLTEIGSRNLSTVEHLLIGYDFHYVKPNNNLYGGVGIYVSRDIGDLQIMNELGIKKTCRCPKCEIESLFIQFKFNYINIDISD